MIVSRGALYSSPVTSSLMASICVLMVQFVEEQGFQRLEDVCLARVVLAQLAAGLGRLDGLEERTKDGGADPRPVEGTRSHELVSHR